MGGQEYVALLRGINVGGRNKIAMSDLRSVFEGAGFTSVRTYIQSGNVVFHSDRPRRELESMIESMLRQRFDMQLVVVVRSRRQMRDVIGSAPDDFGGEPERYHSDVMFLRSPLTASRAMGVIRLRDGVDRAWPGVGVIYFRRLSEQRTRSRMSSIVGTPEYQQITVRNWSTTTKLLALLDEPPQDGSVPQRVARRGRSRPAQAAD